MMMIKMMNWLTMRTLSQAVRQSSKKKKMKIVRTTMVVETLSIQRVAENQERSTWQVKVRMITT